jgi:hypothetical protein
LAKAGLPKEVIEQLKKEKISTISYKHQQACYFSKIKLLILRRIKTHDFRNNVFDLEIKRTV